MMNNAANHVKSSCDTSMSAIGLEIPILITGLIWAWQGMMSDIGTSELVGPMSCITRALSSIGREGNILSYIDPANIVGRVG